LNVIFSEFNPQVTGLVFQRLKVAKRALFLNGSRFILEFCTMFHNDDEKTFNALVALLFAKVMSKLPFQI
jgi:hypothetical protein